VYLAGLSGRFDLSSIKFTSPSMASVTSGVLDPTKTKPEGLFHAGRMHSEARDESWSFEQHRDLKSSAAYFEDRVVGGLGDSACCQADAAFLESIRPRELHSQAAFSEGTAIMNRVRSDTSEKGIERNLAHAAILRRVCSEEGTEGTHLRDSGASSGKGSEGSHL
jgi:hypothetical protein